MWVHVGIHWWNIPLDIKLHQATLLCLYLRAWILSFILDLPDEGNSKITMNVEFFLSVKCMSMSNQATLHRASGLNFKVGDGYGDGQMVMVILSHGFSQSLSI